MLNMNFHEVKAKRVRDRFYCLKMYSSNRKARDTHATLKHESTLVSNKCFPIAVLMSRLMLVK